jgi:hypothetical protein
MPDVHVEHIDNLPTTGHEHVPAKANLPIGSLAPFEPDSPSCPCLFTVRLFKAISSARNSDSDLGYVVSPGIFTC